LKRIVVTGGAGFIGSNIALALAAEGHDVVVVDWLGHGDKWHNLRGCRCADIVPPERLDDVLASGEISAVIHMGAISSTTERDVDLILATNFQVSSKLWTWCSNRHVPFVYASSAATYGDGTHGFHDTEDPAYLARLEPLNPYGWSKHLFDRWAVEQVRRSERTPPVWAGLKYFNVYGPREAHKGPQRSVIAQIYDQVRAGQPARLFKSHHPDYEDGRQLRDFVWVGDAVAATLWFLEGTRPSGLYNVGSGTARSFADAARAVFTALDLTPEIEYVPTPEAVRRHYQYFTKAEMTKLRGAGFDHAPTTLEDGVSRYVEFLKAG